MKQLKFRHHLAELILKGEKTLTWRLFDDKNLIVGDKLEFIDYENGQKFAEAEITHVYEKKLGDVTEADFVGHEKFIDREEMLKNYKGYYGDHVNFDTIVKMISFKLL